MSGVITAIDLLLARSSFIAGRSEAWMASDRLAWSFTTSCKIALCLPAVRGGGEQLKVREEGGREAREAGGRGREGDRARGWKKGWEAEGGGASEGTDGGREGGSGGEKMEGG